jgi:hypothetical protein
MDRSRSGFIGTVATTLSRILWLVEMCCTAGLRDF